MTEVRVNRKAADRVASGHPWIFASDLTDRDGAQPGAAVKVADVRGRPLGTAHYSSTSQIALRMLSPEIEEIGRDFYLRRLRAACAFENQARSVNFIPVRRAHMIVADNRADRARKFRGREVAHSGARAPSFRSEPAGGALLPRRIRRERE